MLPVMGYLSFRKSISETMCFYRPTKPLLFFDKESPAGGLRRSIRQTDTICLRRAGRPVRHDLVGASCTSFASAQARKLTHFAAPPLPKKSLAFWGPHDERAIFIRPQNRCGSLWARTRRQDNETRALDARKASCAAPISMGRGEIPVELRPAAIRFLPLLWF